MVIDNDNIDRDFKDRIERLQELGRRVGSVEKGDVIDVTANSFNGGSKRFVVRDGVVPRPTDYWDINHHNSAEVEPEGGGSRFVLTALYLERATAPKVRLYKESDGGFQSEGVVNDIVVR